MIQAEFWVQLSVCKNEVSADGQRDFGSIETGGRLRSAHRQSASTSISSAPRCCSLTLNTIGKDEEIGEVDTFLLTIPNQLGVAYNMHVMEAILKTIAPALGWR